MQNNYQNLYLYIEGTKKKNIEYSSLMNTGFSTKDFFLGILKVKILKNKYSASTPEENNSLLTSFSPSAVRFEFIKFAAAFKIR